MKTVTCERMRTILLAKCRSLKLQTQTKKKASKRRRAAVEFFEKSSLESKNWWADPARFCLPFYRSFLAIAFKESVTEEQVNLYISEAKHAAGSKSQKFLLEAVENLARALYEIHKERQSSHKGASWVEAQKNLKEIYEPYINRAVELLKEAEITTPGATKCVRKALPIIEKEIMGIIDEIQTKSTALCRTTYGSEIFQVFGTDLNELARKVITERRDQM